MMVHFTSLRVSKANHSQDNFSKHILLVRYERTECANSLLETGLGL
jgi:hypothetical protein